MEEVANTFSVMRSSNGLSQSPRDVDDAKFRASFDLVAKGSGIRNNEPAQDGFIENFNRVARENTTIKC